MAHYPPDYLADLAVHMLAAEAGNNFIARDVLDGAQRGTRGNSPSDGCCTVFELPIAAGRAEPFYFGCDKDGYTVLTARAHIEGWPLSRSGCLLPMRLTRWLVRAPEGTVTRHTCDNPRCIRIAHLKVGQSADNVGDAIRRGRRRQAGDARSAARAGSPRLCGGAPSTPAPAAAETSDAPAMASRCDVWASPSKLARKRRRSATPASARALEADSRCAAWGVGRGGFACAAIEPSRRPRRPPMI